MNFKQRIELSKKPQLSRQPSLQNQTGNSQASRPCARQNLFNNPIQELINSNPSDNVRGNSDNISAQPNRNSRRPSFVLSGGSQQQTDQMKRNAKNQTNNRLSDNSRQMRLPAQSKNKFTKAEKTSQSLSDLDRYSMRPAPAGQFKKFLMSTDNVFYQERPQIKKAEKYSQIIYILLAVLSFLVFILISINYVQRFEGPPPLNGYVESGVLYCNLGYQKVGKNCKVKDIYRKGAENIALDLINTLKLEYGDMDCNNLHNDQSKAGGMKRPTKDITKLWSSLQSASQQAGIIYNEVMDFLDNPKMQAKHKFEFHGHTIWPQEKLHTLKCKMTLFFLDPKVTISILLVLLTAIFGWLLYTQYQQTKKAQNIYKDLKDKVFELETIKVDDYMGQIVKKYGPLDEKMWKMVDEERIKDRNIQYFQDDNLNWRKI